MMATRGGPREGGMLRVDDGTVDGRSAVDLWPICPLAARLVASMMGSQ